MGEFLKYLKYIGIPIIACLFLYLLDPFSQGYLFGWLLVIVIFTKKDFLLKNFDRGLLLILFFSITYALFYSFDYESNGRQYIYNYAFVPPGFYLLGKYFVNRYSTHKNLFILNLFIGIVFSLSALISVLLVFMETGFNSLNRSLPIFWNGNIVNATNMSSFFLFNMSLPGLLLIRQLKLSLVLKIFSGIIFFLSLICVVRLGSRTQLAISVITLLISVFYVLKKQSFKKNIPTFFMIAVLVGIILTNVSFDKNADWMSVYASRMDDSKNVASAGGRSGRWIKAAENIFDKPMGWNKDEFGFAHNLWLDVGMIVGVLPLIFLVFFSGYSYFQIRKALRVSPKQVSFNTMILVYGLSFFLLFFVEPIMVGYFKLFSVFCIFIGVLAAYNTKFSRLHKNY